MPFRLIGRNTLEWSHPTMNKKISSSSATEDTDVARTVAKLSIQYDKMNNVKQKRGTPTGSKARFRRFSELPTEIKLLIWKCAVPDPRDIDGAILYTTNFDTSTSRALIPASPRMKKYCAGPWLRAKTIRIWWTEMCVSCDPVISLMHTCRDARSATLEKFRLSCESTIEGEEQAPWSDSDTVYFPSSVQIGRHKRYDTLLTFWLGIHEVWDKMSLQEPHFSSLKHLALDSMPEFKMRLNGVNEVLDPWLKKFQSLESFTLLFDPRKFGKKQRLVLFEAGDGLLSEYYRHGRGEIVRRTPGYGEKHIVTKAGRILFENGPPKVDCTVLIRLKQRREKAARARRRLRA